ncbi:MAG: sodium/proline symporter [Clostridia bacterium]|nr:sodium/proline symporter [Clostridia bacterium]
MITVGVVFFLRSRSTNDKDYFLGGRRMGPWVTAMSAQASDMSAWLLMGLPGSILAFGLGQAWIGIGLAIGTAANWILVARRLRRFSAAANDSITLPQYLSNRFASKSLVLQVICAIVFLVCFTVYVASAFVAGAQVMTDLFPDMNPTLALFVFAAILIVYTFLGGFKAVCWTDFFQGILMLAAVLLVPLLMVLGQDLNSELLGNTVISISGEEYSFVGNLFSASPIDVINGIAWGLGYFGMPHILVRFMAIKKPSMIKKSAIVAIVWVVLSLGAVVVIAVLGRMIVVDGVPIGEALLAGDKQSMIFVQLSRTLFPAFIAGILLSAIIAASMSTADSQLLVASASFTSDIYKPLIRKNASEKETLWVGRGVVIVIAIVAFFIANSKGEGAQAIMDLVSNAWAGFGSAFGPVVVLSLFWRRFTYKGAVAGVIGGGLVDVLWLVFESNKIFNTGLYEMVPGVIVGTLAAVITTLIDKEPSAEVTAIYDAATGPDPEEELA